MADFHNTGKKGEALAVAYFKAQGYEILETNWQSNHQEVDIIACLDDVLVIAEVKTRKSAFFGAPETFVTRHKQKMLIKAANHYISSNNVDKNVRFDIVSVLLNGEQHHLDHIEDAFYAY